MTTRITPMLWFDHQAEDAANFYVSILSWQVVPTALLDRLKDPDAAAAQRAMAAMMNMIKLDVGEARGAFE